MKKISKITALFTAALFALVGCGKTPTQTSTVEENKDYAVRIAYAPSLCHAPLHVAIEKGFFEQEGLKVEPNPYDSTQTLDAAASDSIDAGYGLFGKFAQPLENGIALKFTAGIHLGCIKVVTKGDSPISSVAELKGKKIGVASLTDTPAIITKRALANAGLDVTAGSMDAELVVFPNADLPNALDRGAIDAFAGMDPSVSVAERDNNLKVLVDTAVSEPFSNEFCCGSFVTDKFLSAHPDLAEKYTNALIKAAHWIAENPGEAAALQVEKNYVAGDAEFNSSLLKNYKFNIASTEKTYDTLLATLQELQKIGVLKPSTNVTDLAKKSVEY